MEQYIFQDGLYNNRVLSTNAHNSEDKGRPAKPTRLMVGLHYLKHTYNLSDEEVVETVICD